MATREKDKKPAAGRAAENPDPRPAGDRDGSFGGALGGGQSGGGAYVNQDDQDPGGVGGQSHQGYYGGGQLGDRNFSESDHSAASKGTSKKRS